MNKEQLQELYNDFMNQADHCFDRAMNAHEIAAGLGDGWELGCQSYEHAAFMLSRKCTSIGIVLKIRISKRQLEIEESNREEMASSFSHEGREEDEG